MSAAKTHIEGIGEVTVIRRRGLKNISLRVDHAGSIRLNLPWFVPKATGLAFVSHKREWIAQQMSKKVIWADGHEISGIKLNIIETDKPKSSWHEELSSLTINIPKNYEPGKKQAVTNKILASYLKTKSEEAIIPKTNYLAKLNNCQVNSITVRKLKSRWGSCDHKGNLTFSLYLYTLPEELWTYVICHELAHLEELNHSQRFWLKVETLYPEYKTAKKSLKNHSPGVYLP